MARRMAIGAAAIVAAVLGVPMTTAAAAPHRENHGALTVLDVFGSYEEMGRQEVVLLGDDVHEAAELYGDHWRGLVRAQGAFGSVIDGLMLPLWTTFGGWPTSTANL